MMQCVLPQNLRCFGTWTAALQLCVATLPWWISSTKGLATPKASEVPSHSEVIDNSSNSAAYAFEYVSHPQWGNLLWEWPTNYWSSLREIASTSPMALVGTAAATAALLPYDDRIQSTVYDFSVDRGLMRQGPQDSVKFHFAKIGFKYSVRLPHSPMGYVWYLGDGMFSVLLSASFAVHGNVAQNYRSSHVAYQILESLTTAGPTVLALKMATGRESPARATRPGGRWQGFPGFDAYTKDQPRYYSYPSGHTTAAVSTLTVLALNYPEQRWIFPVGGVLVGGLMVALMNVESHWASDFPLAVLLGYTSAKAAAERDRLRYQSTGAQDRSAGRGLRWHGVTPEFDGTRFSVQSRWTL